MDNKNERNKILPYYFLFSSWGLSTNLTKSLSFFDPHKNQVKYTSPKIERQLVNLINLSQRQKEKIQFLSPKFKAFSPLQNTSSQQTFSEQNNLKAYLVLRYH